MLLGNIYVIPNTIVAQLLERDYLVWMLYQLQAYFVTESLKYHQMEIQYCFSIEAETFLQIVLLLRFARLHHASCCGFKLIL